MKFLNPNKVKSFAYRTRAINHRSAYSKITLFNPFCGFFSRTRIWIIFFQLCFGSKKVFKKAFKGKFNFRAFFTRTRKRLNIIGAGLRFRKTKAIFERWFTVWLDWGNLLYIPLGKRSSHQLVQVLLKNFGFAIGSDGLFSGGTLVLRYFSKE